MLLGKRPRPPIRRTTSMKGITAVEMGDAQSPPPDHLCFGKTHHGASSSEPLSETAHFLRTCGLCQRRLAPGRDIYMYRGDTAFCSADCREIQMKRDERKDKCSPPPAAPGKG